MKSFLSFIGAAIYGYATSWCLWLIIWWFSPIVMSIGWSWWLLLYFICYSILSHLACRISGILFSPYVLFFNAFNHKWSFVIPTIFYLIYGFRAIMEPYKSGIDSFGFIQWVLALSVSLLAYLLFLRFFAYAYMCLKYMILTNSVK